MATKTFLKVLAAFFSTIFISLGITLIFFAFAISQLPNHADELSPIVDETTTQFLAEHREEVKGFVDLKLREENALPDFSLMELKAGCSEQMQLPDDQKIVPQNVCDNVDTFATAEEARSAMLDSIIDKYGNQFKDEILSQAGTQQIEGALEELSLLFNSMIFVIIAGLVMYLFGVFLTFAASSYNLTISVYRIALKTTLNLLFVGIVFMYFKFMDVDFLVGLAKEMAVKLGEGFVLPSELPEFVIKLIAQIIINWLSLSVSSAAKLALLISVPFALLTGALIIVRVVRRKKLALEEKALSKNDKKYVPKEEVL